MTDGNDRRICDFIVARFFGQSAQDPFEALACTSIEIEDPIHRRSHPHLCDSQLLEHAPHRRAGEKAFFRHIVLPNDHRANT